jgi:F-type H+-transporting ATPase subunit delta
LAVAQSIYAKALFEAAKEKGSVPQVRVDLADFVEAVEASSELRNLLLNPRIDARAKQAGLDAVFGDASPLFANFLKLLAQKGRLGEIAEIHRAFERLVAAEERILNVELITARDLSAAEVDEIIAKIAQASGRKVDATRSVDPSLIGGMVLQAGSFRADASVRGRLTSLRQELATRS